MKYIPWSHKKIDPREPITYVVMFDGASNVQLGGEPLKIHYPNISVMCVVEHTVSSFFDYFSKPQLWIRRLHLIRQYTTYLVLVYTTKLIIYSNQKYMNFTMGALVYSVEMIPGWMVLSLEYTETCKLRK